MKEILKNLNKAFESKIRLGIMSVLTVNDSIDFKSLKSLLGVTDGNLASHLKFLEKENFLQVKKEFVGRKPKTTYLITASGRAAFEKHIKAIEDLLT